MQVRIFLYKIRRLFNMKSPTFPTIPPIFYQLKINQKSIRYLELITRRIWF